MKTSLLPAIVTCHFSHHAQGRGVIVSTLEKARPDLKGIYISVHRFIILVA